MSEASATFVLSLIPPSTNAIYRSGRYGRPELSAAARKFVIQVQEQMSQQLTGQVNFRRDVPLELELWFDMPEIFNKTWPDGDAKTRFKKANDLSNLVKLLEDTVMKVFGLDDSCVTNITLRKRRGPPRTVIRLRELPETCFADLCDWGGGI